MKAGLYWNNLRRRQEGLNRNLTDDFKFNLQTKKNKYICMQRDNKKSRPICTPSGYHHEKKNDHIWKYNS